MVSSHRYIAGALALALNCPTAVSGSSIPEFPNSTLPSGIVLVGEAGGVTDPAGNFTIVIRDLANNPVAAANVVIAFDQCGTDIGVCAVPGLPGTEVQCMPPIVTALTDFNGAAHFAIRGSGLSLQPSTVGSCAQVYADGVMIGTLSVAAFDLDGHGGVGPPDISRWLSDYFTSYTSSTPFSRGDYNFSGSLTAADFALLLRAALGGQSIGSCLNSCN